MNNLTELRDYVAGVMALADKTAHWTRDSRTHAADAAVADLDRLIAARGVVAAETLARIEALARDWQDATLTGNAALVVSTFIVVLAGREPGALAGVAEGGKTIDMHNYDATAKGSDVPAESETLSSRPEEIL